jgi:hypothetical protein
MVKLQQLKNFTMKKLMYTLVLCAGFIFTATAQSDAYKSKLDKMFEVSGSKKAYNVAIDQVVTMFRQQNSEIEEKIWDDFAATFKSSALKDLTNVLAPVYHKYLNEKDLDNIIAFYQSESGAKLGLNTPAIMQESMQIGQQWGQKIGADFAKKLADYQKQ